MKLKMFSVFDTKMAVFANPFYDQREESAIRSFSDAVNDPNPNNMWNKHPEDFSLYMIGEFDNDTGEIDLYKPQNLVTASALMSLRRDLPSKISEVVNHKEKAPVA